MKSLKVNAFTGGIADSHKLYGGIVVDVVTDENHKDIAELEINVTEEKRNVGLIGCAKIKRFDDNSSNPNNLKYYRPHSYSDLELPIIGETVELIKTNGGSLVYKRLPSQNINTGNAITSPSKKFFPQKDTPSPSKDYKTVSQTGTPNSSNSEVDEPSNEYFESSIINPLQFFEGDKLIQSRFGQSIRFSGYNNEEKTFAPTIIIRNRQGDESKKNNKKGAPIYENIVDDGSTIVLSSGKHLLNFTPGTFDTPLETEPIKATEPELKDRDQILINSGRIILSSKDSEMLFYSKGDYGFISDGKFTIDNGEGGADLDFGDDVNITTDRLDGNFSVLTGNGEIRLNTDEQGNSPSTGDREPIVRGQVLVNLLTELIDEINKQVYSTPAGPTAVGPNNASKFETIKGKLTDFLSTLNYTQ